MFNWANQFALPAIAGEIADRYRATPRYTSTSAGRSRRRAAPRVAASSETHAIQTSLGNATDLDTLASFTHLNVIPTGNTIRSRVGSKVRMTKLTIRGSLTAGTAQTLPVTARLIVILDKDPRLAVPIWGDVFDNTDVWAIKSNEEGDRFKILYDRNFSVVGDGDTLTGASPLIQFSATIPINKMAKWEATNTSGSYSAQLQGCLWFVTICNVADAGDNVPFISGNSKLEFLDM